VIPDRAGSFPTPPPTAGTPPSAQRTPFFDSYKVSLRNVQTETQQTQRKNLDIRRAYLTAENTANQTPLDGTLANHEKWYSIRNGLISALAVKVKNGDPIRS
jgi:hypothetical protein